MCNARTQNQWNPSTQTHSVRLLHCHSFIIVRQDLFRFTLFVSLTFWWRIWDKEAKDIKSNHFRTIVFSGATYHIVRAVFLQLCIYRCPTVWTNLCSGSLGHYHAQPHYYWTFQECVVLLFLVVVSAFLLQTCFKLATKWHKITYHDLKCDSLNWNLFI